MGCAQVELEDALEVDIEDTAAWGEGGEGGKGGAVAEGVSCGWDGWERVGGGRCSDGDGARNRREGYLGRIGMTMLRFPILYKKCDPFLLSPRPVSSSSGNDIVALTIHLQLLYAITPRPLPARSLRLTNYPQTWPIPKTLPPPPSA